MKFCSHCGKEIVDDAVVCPNCGCAVAPTPHVEDIPNAGLNVLSFLFPIVGLILFIIYNEKTPIKAKAIGKCALIGFGIGVFFAILISVLQVSMYSYY